MPYTRQGSDPDRLLPLIREVGLVFPPEHAGLPPLSSLRAVLTIAEQAFGLSVQEEDFDHPLPCARILPVLPPLPSRGRPPDGGPWPVGDPVIDLLMAHADQRAISSAAMVQARGLLRDSGLAEYSELTQAVDEAGAGGWGILADEDPAGLVLRRIRRDEYEAERDGYRRRHLLGPDERRRNLASGATPELRTGAGRPAPSPGPGACAVPPPGSPLLRHPDNGIAPWGLRAPLGRAGRAAGAEHLY